MSSIGVGAGGDVAHALVDDGLGQHGGGGGAVTGDVVGLGGGFLEELRAHVLEVVVELDLLGDGDAVVGDGRGAALLVERDIAALGAEGGLDGIGEGVDTLFQGLACLGVELQNLGHEELLAVMAEWSGRVALRCDDGEDVLFRQDEESRPRRA